VKVKEVLAVRPETDPVVPVPVAVNPPGLDVIVQVPEAGRPLRATLPVATVHVGAVMVPTVGAAGVGTGLMVIALVEGEVHGPVFVTLQVYVPGGMPDRVNAPPDQVALAPAGELVRFHIPLVGSPENSMLPVGTAHVGWVIVPTSGVDAGPA
jgi:hypothetical protein